MIDIQSEDALVIVPGAFNERLTLGFGYGGLAQLVERCDRTAEVRGSNPLSSIKIETAGVMNWTSDAEKALQEVPFFVRPAVRRRIESMAAEQKRELVDCDFYQEAKSQFADRS